MMRASRRGRALSFNIMTPRFRIGSTSYVYPGDLVCSAERLAGQVDDVELILFETMDGMSNFPDEAAVARLAQIAQAHHMTYTVHLPLDLRYTEGDTHESLRQAERVISLTAPLDPFAIIFHLEGTDAGTATWTQQALRAVDWLVNRLPQPEVLALENLENYAPEHLLPIFARFPISRTLDVGHLWKAGRDPFPVMEAWLPHTRVVHLHGMAATDHQPLSVTPPVMLDAVISRLVKWAGVLTLEVYENDFFDSLTALNLSLARVTT
jgi:sugar phosphate isomerase/epimerase